MFPHGSISYYFATIDVSCLEFDLDCIHPKFFNLLPRFHVYTVWELFSLLFKNTGVKNYILIFFKQTFVLLFFRHESTLHCVATVDVNRLECYLESMYPEFISLLLWFLRSIFPFIRGHWSYKLLLDCVFIQNSLLHWLSIH